MIYIVWIYQRIYFFLQLLWYWRKVGISINHILFLIWKEYMYTNGCEVLNNTDKWKQNASQILFSCIKLCTFNETKHGNWIQIPSMCICNFERHQYILYHTVLMGCHGVIIYTEAAKMHSLQCFLRQMLCQYVHS